MARVKVTKPGKIRVKKKGTLYSGWEYSYKGKKPPTDDEMTAANLDYLAKKWGPALLKYAITPEGRPAPISPQIEHEAGIEAYLLINKCMNEL